MDSEELAAVIAHAQAALSTAAAMPTAVAGQPLTKEVLDVVLLIRSALEQLPPALRAEYAEPLHQILQKLAPCSSDACLMPKQDGHPCHVKMSVAGTTCTRHRSSGVAAKICGINMMNQKCCTCLQKLDATALLCASCPRGAHLGCVHPSVELTLVGAKPDLDNTHVCMVCASHNTRQIELLSQSVLRDTNIVVMTVHEDNMTEEVKGVVGDLIEELAGTSHEFLCSYQCLSLGSFMSYPSPVATRPAQLNRERAPVEQMMQSMTHAMEGVNLRNAGLEGAQYGEEETLDSILDNTPSAHDAAARNLTQLAAQAPINLGGSDLLTAKQHRQVLELVKEGVKNALVNNNPPPFPGGRIITPADPTSRYGYVVQGPGNWWKV